MWTVDRPGGLSRDKERVRSSRSAAFTRTKDEAQARRIITEYRSDYLLICPNMATATIFMAEAPRGFYGQLVKGKVPAWLQPIDLGRDSPYKMWKVVGAR